MASATKKETREITRLIYRRSLENTKLLIGKLWNATGKQSIPIGAKKVTDFVKVVEAISVDSIKINELPKIENDDLAKENANRYVVSKLQSTFILHQWPTNIYDNDVTVIWSLAMCLSCAEALDQFSQNRYDAIKAGITDENTLDRYIKEISEAMGYFIFIYVAFKCIYNAPIVSQRKYRLDAILTYSAQLKPEYVILLSKERAKQRIMDAAQVKIENVNVDIIVELDRLWSQVLPDADNNTSTITTANRTETENEFAETTETDDNSVIELDDEKDSVNLDSVSVIIDDLQEETDTSSNKNVSTPVVNRSTNIPSFTKAATPSVTKTPVGFGSGTSKGSNAPNRTNTLPPLQLPETAVNETKPKSALQRLADGARKTIKQIRDVNRSPTLPSKSEQKIQPLVNPNPSLITRVTQTFGGNRNRSKSQDSITTQPTSVFSTVVSPEDAASLKHPLEEMTTADWDSLFAFIATRAS